MLDPGLDPGPVPLEFELTSDGTRVVFKRAFSQLCSVRTDGGEPTVVLADDASFVFVSSDSRHVVFLAPGGLWSVPIDGSSAPLLLHAHPFIHWFIEFTPDGSHVLYDAVGTFALSGRLNVHLPESGDWFELSRLDCLFIPEGTPHEYWSYGAETTTAAFCVVPGYR